jgi:hypothetical protein
LGGAIGCKREEKRDDRKDIARQISSRLWPGFKAAVTYGGTAYLVSGSDRLRQLQDDEIQAISPEVWPNLLELGRGTVREEICRRGAISERDNERVEALEKA